MDNRRKDFISSRSIKIRVPSNITDDPDKLFGAAMFWGLLKYAGQENIPVESVESDDTLPHTGLMGKEEFGDFTEIAYIGFGHSKDKICFRDPDHEPAYFAKLYGSKYAPEYLWKEFSGLIIDDPLFTSYWYKQLCHYHNVFGEGFLKTRNIVNLILRGAIEQGYFSEDCTRIIESIGKLFWCSFNEYLECPSEGIVHKRLTSYRQTVSKNCVIYMLTEFVPVKYILNNMHLNGKRKFAAIMINVGAHNECTAAFYKLNDATNEYEIIDMYGPISDIDGIGAVVSTLNNTSICFRISDSIADKIYRVLDSL